MNASLATVSTSLAQVNTAVFSAFAAESHLAGMSVQASGSSGNYVPTPIEIFAERVVKPVTDTLGSWAGRSLELWRDFLSLPGAAAAEQNQSGTEEEAPMSFHIPLGERLKMAYQAFRSTELSSTTAERKESSPTCRAQTEFWLLPSAQCNTLTPDQDKALRKDPDTVQLLDFCTHLPPGNVPASLLESWFCAKNLESSRQDFQKALQTLEETSIVVRQGLDISFMQCSRIPSSDPQAKEILTLGITVVTERLKADGTMIRQREAGKSLIRYAQSLLVQAKEQKLVNEHVGALATQVGYFFRIFGDQKEAVPYYKTAIDTYLAVYGTRAHLSVATAYNDLSPLLILNADFASAKSHAKSALNIQTDIYGIGGHSDMAKSYNNLGHVQLFQGDAAGAEAFYRKALEILEEFYGPKTTVTDHGITRHNLAVALQQQGNLVSAKTEFELALQAKIKGYGTKEHGGVAITYSKLGSLLEAQRDPAGAEKAYHEALRIFVAVYNTEEHADVAATYLSLANVYRAMKHQAAANASFAKAVSISQHLATKKEGEPHPARGSSVPTSDSL